MLHPRAPEDDDGFSLLLEYASGGSLFSLLRKQSFLPEGEARREHREAECNIIYYKYN